jgi:hypothetical protein
LAAVLVVIVILLPPLPATAPSPSWRPSSPIVRGVFHVHTRRSDGTGTVEEVAAATAKAGLQFVILTDHGDATRQPDAPSYKSGVLCIDAVEISTTGGHYAALGLGRAPYPLAGEPRDVAEDVRRLGGFGIVTHPLSGKPGLAWQGWGVPFDGIEWLNGDSVWRDAPLWRLARAAWTYPFRPMPSIARLYQRPPALAKWAGLTKGRRVVVLAGTDAHARIGFRDGPEPYANPVFLRVPSYQTAFEVASLQVALPLALSRNAARDAEAVIAAIRAGHVHTVVDALAGPAAFEFSAKSGAVSAMEGDTLPLADPVVVRVRANPPAGGWIVLFRDGAQVHRVAASELVYASDLPGVYRAEVWLPAEGLDGFTPWIVSNPIYAGTIEAPAAPAAIDMTGPTFRLEVAETFWGVEHDAGSRAELDRQGDGIALRYALARTGAIAPYAALTATTLIDSRATGIAFRGSAGRPMRLSVQLRVPTVGDGNRWQRSVYLDPTVRDVVVPFADMTRVGEAPIGLPQLADVRTLLFVIDRVNAHVGASGRFALDEVRLFAPGAPIADSALRR